MVDNLENLLQNLEVKIQDFTSEEICDIGTPDNYFPLVTTFTFQQILQFGSKSIEASVCVTPGEYFLDTNGKWFRHYGGIFEIIEVRINGLELGTTEYTKPYGIYNRPTINGLPQWVRIDSNKDFLGIDKTSIQTIKSLYK